MIIILFTYLKESKAFGDFCYMSVTINLYKVYISLFYIF
uniref:Uncharacterized protein n=1 Tax=Dipterosiphonia australica TaxID=2007208 RepID=A0A1Z1MMB4_9FLOR|nr:hypothetical protein [Dipterosiphonia australica]ARW66935.1 hypothetical protein [Dipterosiphonia australica]